MNFSVDLMDIELPDLEGGNLADLSALNTDAFLADYLASLETRMDDPGAVMPGASLTIPDSFNVDATMFDAVPNPALLHITSDSGSAGSHPFAQPPEAAHVIAGAGAARTLQTKDSTGSANNDKATLPRTDTGDEAGVKAEVEDAVSGQRSGGIGTRKVTPQRKQNNRKAQQRYREKRKMQAVEMEQQVTALAAELQALKGLKTEAAQVSEENKALRDAMTQQMEEIERLKRELDARTLSASADSLPISDSVDLADEQHAQAVNMSSEEAARRLHAAAQAMRALLEAAGLPTTSVLKGDRRYQEAGLVAELRKLIDEADKASMTLLLSTPACPYEKSTLSAESAGSAHPCVVFRTRWRKIIDTLCMSTAQVDALLAARQQLLDRLRGIYEERCRLNIQTMGIMLPRPDPSKNFDGTTASKLRCMEQYGSTCALRQGYELNEVLDSLKLNLRAEQKLMLQMHEVLLKKILEPAQAAMVFMFLEAEPIEPLHFTNLLALERGLVSDPCATKVAAALSAASGPQASAPAALAVLG